jgi:hypothetical protein
VLPTPQHKTNEVAAIPAKESRSQVEQRKSPRLKEKATKSKPIIKLAQELVAKKWGILKEDTELDNMTLKQYMDMYKQPLIEETIEAIEKLTKVAVDMKTKKDKKKKKKKGKESLSTVARKKRE